MKLNSLKAILGATMLAAISGQAFAGVTFSNVTVTGGLATGVGVNIGASDIDFSFPNALVGDFLPSRLGVITITYEATADEDMVANTLGLSLLGALSGSGVIYFNEVIEDVNTAAILATHNVTLSDNSDLPYTHTLVFSEGTKHFKAKKTLILAAPDTQDFDLAGVALIEQRIQTVPEPASMAVLGLGAAALAARRRKKA